MADMLTVERNLDRVFNNLQSSKQISTTSMGGMFEVVYLTFQNVFVKVSVFAKSLKDAMSSFCNYFNLKFNGSVVITNRGTTKYRSIKAIDAMGRVPYVDAVIRKVY